MGISRIFVTADQAQAAQTEGFWRTTPGYHVAAIGPTDGCEVDDIATGAPLWAASGNGPWYVVIVTPDRLQTATAG